MFGFFVCLVFGFFVGYFFVSFGFLGFLLWGLGFFFLFFWCCGALCVSDKTIQASLHQAAFVKIVSDLLFREK